MKKTTKTIKKKKPIYKKPTKKPTRKYGKGKAIKTVGVRG